MFRQHNFQEVERFYAESTKLRFSKTTEELAEKLVMGQTTIVYRCVGRTNPEDGCGKTYKEEILGKSTKINK